MKLINIEISVISYKAWFSNSFFVFILILLYFVVLLKISWVVKSLIWIKWSIVRLLQNCRRNTSIGLRKTPIPMESFLFRSKNRKHWRTFLWWTRLNKYSLRKKKLNTQSRTCRVRVRFRRVIKATRRTSYQFHQNRT